jgi:hypothetical protein
MVCPESRQGDRFPSDDHDQDEDDPTLADRAGFETVMMVGRAIIETWSNGALNDDLNLPGSVAEHPHRAARLMSRQRDYIPKVLVKLVERLDYGWTRMRPSHR